MNVVLAIGLLLISGVAAGRLAGELKMSSVTGYLVAGLVLGQVWPGIRQPVSGMAIALATDIGLGLIAFVVGGELEAGRLRSLARGVLGMALAQALGAFALVALVSVLLGHSSGVGLVIGAIAAATAPASTIMVVRRHKAEGPLTQALIPVVAIDDAICI
ncbi:MAG: cation:proton antiporter, partial [Firmicutes bacterium]|nr:cation:proton antiporter [Bacillota bacterium]